MRQTRTIAGAAYWASYIINGDASGLEPAEKTACDVWLEKELLPGESIVDCDSEPYFSWSYGFYTGADCKGGDLLDYTVLAETFWYTSGSGRIEIEMTYDQARGASHQGQCDEDVEALSKEPDIAAQLEKIDRAALASELRGYGAWNDKELADHDQNLQRVLWLAAGDIVDNARSRE